MKLLSSRMTPGVTYTPHANGHSASLTLKHHRQLKPLDLIVLATLVADVKLKVLADVHFLVAIQFQVVVEFFVLAFLLLLNVLALATGQT
jgi:hypothetical protein